MLKNGFDKKDFHFLITTNTVTSSNFVNNKIKNGFPGTHQFNPLDNPKFVDNFLDFWTPEMAIFVESDFWPNLIYRSSIKNIPLILASSQMSKNHLDFGVVGRGLAKKVFKKLILFWLLIHLMLNCLNLRLKKSKKFNKFEIYC